MTTTGTRSRAAAVIIAAGLAAGAACGRNGPARQPPAPAAEVPTAPPPAAPAPQPAAPPPARTELDRTPGFVTHEEDRPKREGDAYVASCPLNGLESARARIGKDRRLSLLLGARTLATVKLDDDFFSPDLQVICAKSFVTLHRDQGDRYRDATFTWTQRRLVKSGRSDGPIEPIRGP